MSGSCGDFDRFGQVSKANSMAPEGCRKALRAGVLISADHTQLKSHNGNAKDEHE